MRPKIFDLLFKDDRMFVLEVRPVTTSPLTSSDIPKKEVGCNHKTKRAGVSASPNG